MPPRNNEYLILIAYVAMAAVVAALRCMRDNGQSVAVVDFIRFVKVVMNFECKSCLFDRSATGQQLQ